MFRRLFQRKFRVQSQPIEAFSQELGDHRLQFEPGNTTLVVSFDNAARPEQEAYDGRPTWGDKFYRGEGYSILGVIARRAIWYRDPKVIAALETLRDSGFFASFDRVIMSGGSMGGFAAAAFAPLAPNAIVIAFSPQSTLDTKKVPWEWRYAEGKAQNWTLPYGDAVDGLADARHCYIVYDGLDRPDKRHARRFGHPDKTTHLNLPGGGHGVSPLLSQMGLLKLVTQRMIDMSLDGAEFQSLARRRKTALQYHRVMANHAIKRKKFALAKNICDAAMPQFPQSDLASIQKKAAGAESNSNVGGIPVTHLQLQSRNVGMNTTKPHRLNGRFPELKRNIFIVTYGRTGSTLLQSLVQTLPACTIRGENHNVIETIWNAAMRARMTRGTWGNDERQSNHPWFGADTIRPALFAAGMVDSMIDNVLVPPRNAKYFGFKEIRYNALGDRFSDMLDFMRFHFKDPIFVFNTRNVADVAQSAWWKDWKSEDVERLVRDMDRRFIEYHNLHKECSIMMSYEHFSQDPTALKPLFDMLDEPYDQKKINDVLAMRLTH